jgi:hypothetical protein
LLVRRLAQREDGAVKDKISPENLLEQGLRALGDLLGPTWNLSVRPEAEEGLGERRADSLVELRSEGDTVFAQLLIDLKTQVTPRTVEEQLLPKLDLVRRVTVHTNLMVMAPWISPRTQRVLREHGINYLDLTGNVSLRVARPAIVIHAQGDTRAPRAERIQPGKTTLAGPRVGRLVRLMTDVAPPYRARELASAASLSLPYVSRLLDTIEDQLVIQRDGRVITDVDWPNLLRLRSEQLNLLKQNPFVSMLAPNGTRHLMERLREVQQNTELGSRIVLTGSYAARAIAPLAVEGQVMLYVPVDAHSPDDIADELGLLRVDEGGDVLLLRPNDEVVFQRTVSINGIRQVALSQLVLDCLSGPGRMPAEGEAVIDYMIKNQQDWRSPTLQTVQEQSSL